MPRCRAAWSTWPLPIRRQPRNPLDERSRRYPPSRARRRLPRRCGRRGQHTVASLWPKPARADRGGIQQRLRLLHLLNASAVQGRRSRLQRDAAAMFKRISGSNRADRWCPGADERRSAGPPGERLRERAFTITRGAAATGMNERRRTRRAPRPQRRPLLRARAGPRSESLDRHGHARRVVRVRDGSTRVCGVMAASTASSAKRKSGFGITRTTRPPATAVSKPKISNAGSGTIASGTRPLPAVGRRYAMATAMMPSSRPFTSVTWSVATPKYRAALSVTAA